MKKENELKVYLLAQTTLLPEWISLMGDKYLHALPFTVQFTEEINEAEVIAWDGFLSSKGAYYLGETISRIKAGKVLLLLQREAFTLFKDHPYLTYIDPDPDHYVELPGGNVLPEDLLSALETCYKKLQHV
ncbi:MAG TPA: hypothetical protein VNJ08_15235 [Bacteriovoracaceae bacterium]|nr:hypothetical protein [Bacteriovoracaceae bacterium]